MNKYKYCSLKELVSKASTGLDAIKRAPIVDHNTGTRCLRIQDVSQKKEFSSWGYCSVTVENFKRFSLNPEEIIVARTGNTIGVNMYISNKLKSVFNNGLIRLRVNSSICLSKYLYYNLQSTAYWAHIESIAFGTSTQPNMQIDSLLQFQVPLPSISIQTLIASILSSLDDKIELNRQMNQTLEEMAQALFKKYFVDGIDKENLPVGWRAGKLGDIVHIKGGTTPSTKQMELWNGGISWTSPKDLSKIKSNVLLKTEKTLTQAGLKKISSGLLPIGTLLLSSRAPIGYLAITQIPVAINQGYIAILNNEVYSNIFMLFWLKNNMDIIVRNANGSTFLEVSKSVFRSIDLNIPPAELLQQFNVAVLPLFERIVKNEKEIETLIEMRNNLLPKLMSGEIDVTSFSTEAVSSDSDPLKLQPTS